MCATKTISCVVDQVGVLTPDPTGTFNVVLARTPAQGDDPPTGTISWFNKVQAFITFDVNGQCIVGFHVTDMSINSHITQKSVENLLPYF